MPQLVIEGVTLANQTMLDHGITDLLVHQGAQGAVLYATSGPNGGLTAYAIGAGGGLSLIDFVHFPADIGPGVLEGLTILETAEGPRIVVAADATDGLTAFALGTTGMIDGTVSMNGISAANGAVLTLDQWGNNTLLLADASDGPIRGYALETATQLTPQFATIDAQASYTDSVFAMETVSMAGGDFLLGASVADRGITAYRIAAQGLVATGNLGATEGIGIMTPTALATAEVGGRHFVLLGSAPSDGIGQSGAITVMELRQDGSLWPIDHVLDTLNTRFGMIQSLDVVTSNGITYVMAAGGDDGLSMFVLLPNGRLMLLDQVTDSFAVGLENVTDVTAVDGSDGVRVFVASEISAGVTQLSLDTTRNGAVATADVGGTLSGTSRDDILVGGGGNDLITASFGDDILEDGGGQDTLTGGGGRDIFVLRADGQTDRITDFELGRDRLDLSDWPFFYDPWGLSVLPTSGGAIVSWRNETLVIETLHGIALSTLDIVTSILPGPERRPIVFESPPDPVIYGTEGDDSMDGGPTGDVIDGRAGNDTINGLDGDDTLLGGSGFDELQGGLGADSLDGGDQADNLHGDGGNDTLLGGNGNDRLFGGVDHDSLMGDQGEDLLIGEGGNDTLRGGEDNDRIYGGTGFDFLHGDAGDDQLWGEGNADRLYGGAGDDTVWGGDGLDELYGGDGDDSLVGDGGNDRLFGGADNDTLEGGRDNDLLFGEDGSDRLFGGLSFDWLRGGDGDDYLHGGDQADNLFGDAGNDTLEGGNGFDRMFGGAGDDLIVSTAGVDALFGESGNDTLIGSAEGNRLWGGSGFDRLEGGGGNDEIWGDFNADTFVFGDGHGADTIRDFEALNALERIDLSGIAALSGFADYTAFAASGAVSTVAGGVLLATGGGNSILLAGVAIGDLDDGDFIF